MPNLFTHHLLVKEFYEGVKPFDSFMKNNFDCLALGTQGPDPLFYEGIVPGHMIRPKLAKAKLGNEIHRSDGTKFMAQLLNQEDMNDGYKAFAFGQFCHYILDRICHPFVYYMSGFDQDGKLTGKYHYSHSHFESELDVAMCLTHDFTSALKDPAKLFPADKETLEKIEKGMTGAVSELFNRKLPKDYYKNAVCNMRNAIKAINKMPEFMIKVMGNFVLAGQRLPHSCDRSVLNEAHELWKHPVTGEEHHDSFEDLFQEALNICRAAYKDIIVKGLNLETLLPYYNGLNYKGTVPGALLRYKK